MYNVRLFLIIFCSQTKYPLASCAKVIKFWDLLSLVFAKDNATGVQRNYPQRMSTMADNIDFAATSSTQNVDLVKAKKG